MPSGRQGGWAHFPRNDRQQENAYTLYRTSARRHGPCDTCYNCDDHAQRRRDAPRREEWRMSATDTNANTKTNTSDVAAEARARMRGRERSREKERVLRSIDKNWRAFLDSTYAIPEGMAGEGGVRGDWSVKDILTHVAAWDREAVRVTLQIMRGDEPTWPAHEQKFDDLNYEADRHLSVVEARNRALSAHKALVEMLDGKSEVRGEWVAAVTYEHYPEHTAEIVRWRGAHGLVATMGVRSGDANDALLQDRTSTSSAHDNVPTPEGNTPGRVPS